MIMSMKMESLCNRKNRHGIMDEQLMVQDSDHDVSNSSSNSTSTTNEEEEEEDEVSSSGPLQDMTSLLQQLPLKRGLSKHYNGKSQSFTSLSSAGCLEDLAKPENPYNKRLKTCKSYRELPRNNTCSKLIVKRASKTNNNNNNNNKDHLSSIFSSLGGGGINGRRYSSFYGNINRPPIPAVPRSTSAASSNQTPLFV